MTLKVALYPPEITLFNVLSVSLKFACVNHMHQKERSEITIVAIFQFEYVRKQTEKQILLDLW